MKKILLSIIIMVVFVSSPVFSASLWELQDTGENIQFMNIFFLDNGQDGWISTRYYDDGYCYTILRTTDSGNNWTTQEGDRAFDKLFFVDKDNGWGFYYFYVYHTADGGSTWEVQEVSSTKGIYSSNDLNDMFFLDSTHGWIVGEEVIHKTEDGSTWVMKSTETIVDIQLNGVYFVNQSSGWAVGYTYESEDYHAVILHTYDGGESWEEQDISENIRLYSVDFVDNNNGWVTGGYGRVFHTDNGGTTWSVQETNIYDESFTQVDFKDVNNGWILGSMGTVCSSTNGGNDWVEKIKGEHSYYDGYAKQKVKTADVLGTEVKESGSIKSGMAMTNSSADDFHVIDSSTVWLVSSYYSYSSLVKTGDGGETWELLRGNDSSIQSIFFTDVNNGWAVGENGIIFSTQDSGLNWDMLDTGTTGYLRDVYFNDGNNGWIAGDSVVYGTGDGGDTWNLLAEPTNYLLFSCHFADNSKGWAVGYDKVSDRSKIMNTANGGTGWNEQYSGEEEARLYSVFFTDTNNGWAVGTDNIILHTSNGGSNWELQTSTASVTLRGVYFINSTTGWACGDDGTILSTDDGGSNWVVGSIEGFSYNSYNDFGYYNPYDLRDIHFIDENNGWIISDYGIIIHTQDGGSTWKWKEMDVESGSSYSSRYMVTVFFIDEENGWIAGGNTILKLKNMGIIATSQVDNKLVIGNNVLNIAQEEKAYIYWNETLTNVRIKIFTLDGTLIRMYDISDYDREDHLEWNGTYRDDDDDYYYSYGNRDGRYVSQGVYLVLLESDEGKEVEKVFVIRK